MARQSCPRCGEQRIGNFAFCRSCGFDYDAMETSSAAPPVSADPQRAVRSPWWRSRRGIVAIVVGLLLVVVAVGGWSANSAAETPEARATGAPTPGSSGPLPLPSATAAAASPLPLSSPTGSPVATPIPSLLPATVALPKLSAKVAGATKIRYFSVVGDSPIDLIDQTVDKSKPFCKSADTLACTLNSVQPRWIETTNVGTGSCKVTSVRVVYKATVSLPRWTGPSRVQPALIAWWKTFLDHLAWHEGQHITIQKSHDSKLRSLLVGHKCSTARAIIAKWERGYKVAQDQFDIKDQSWEYPEYTGPGGFYGLG